MTAPRDPDAQDPDRTLPLLSETAFEEDRPSPYVFLLGLAGIAAFLLLVAFVFTHLSP